MVVPNEAVSSGEIPVNKAQLFQVAANQQLSVFSSLNVIMVLIMVLSSQFHHHVRHRHHRCDSDSLRPHAIGDLCCHVHQSTVTGERKVRSEDESRHSPRTRNVGDLGGRSLGLVTLQELSEISLLRVLLDEVPGVGLQIDSDHLCNVPVIN